MTKTTRPRQEAQKMTNHEMMTRLSEIDGGPAIVDLLLENHAAFIRRDLRPDARELADRRLADDLTMNLQVARNEVTR